MFSKIQSQNTNEVVTLQEAKKQLGLLDSETIDDVLIQMYIVIASDIAQKFTRRLLSPGVIELVTSNVNAFFLPYGGSTDEVFTVQTVGDDPQDVEFTYEPISEIFTFSSDVDLTQTVKITFNAGYAPGLIPPCVRIGVLMAIANFYEFREDFTVDTRPTEIPLTSQHYLSMVRVQVV